MLEWLTSPFDYLLLQYEGYIDEKLGVEAPAPAQTVSAAVPAPAQ